MVWGQVAGAVVGGYMANQAAKKQAKAMDAANRMSNMGYLDAQPYINFGYSGGKGALQDVLNTGAYDGQTYAGLNPMQNAALNNQFDFGGTANQFGQNLAGTGANFGGNYNTLFNQAMGGQAMDNAINYATQNRGGLVDAALRDSTRQLTEQTLPGINRAASATGNTNSSRAGIADAMANRAYQDRAADVSSDITNTLMNQSLAQQQRDFGNAMSANQGLASAFGTGINTGFQGLGQQLAAGGAFQRDEQNQLTDDQTNFQNQRDFELDQYNKFMAGILGRAPTQGKNYAPNLVDPTSAALSGAIGGFGLGGQMFGGGGFGGGSAAMPTYAMNQSGGAKPLSYYGAF
tara:strand:+ start:4448 stop:5488 length:1041 start_codon:yes stop_codon:yes gene_type:complete